MLVPRLLRQPKNNGAQTLLAPNEQTRNHIIMESSSDVSSNRSTNVTTESQIVGLLLVICSMTLARRLQAHGRSPKLVFERGTWRSIAVCCQSESRWIAVLFVTS